MAWLYKTDGTKQEIQPADGKKFSLKELQQYVGGYIQIVDSYPGTILVVNENGKVFGMPLNVRATRNYKHGHLDPIVGDVVHCNRKEIS